MIDWYKKVVFENYANFKGRARRSEYWYFTLANIIISILLMLLDNALGLKIGSSNSGVLNSIYGLIVFLPGLAVAVRRLHDIGKSGKLLLLFYIAIIVLAIVMVVAGLSLFMAGMGNSGAQTPDFGSLGIGFFIPLILILGIAIWMLILFFTAGDVGANKYGPDPKCNCEEINEIGTE